MASDTSNKSEIGIPSHYIAIGASAGGFEALQDFFQHMPSSSGATFIVIQHLSPDFKSIMAELLNRTSNMEALNAIDGVSIEPNKIYLIPPRKNMMIAEGRLILSDQMRERGPSFPIDIFFRSVAQDQHHKAIGIILSGTGSDGSRGLHAIKEVGGLVVVQEPASAKFDGMPYNAVKTGLADLVLTPADMPSKLVNYITHPLISGEDDSLLQSVKDNDSALKQIFDIINQNSENDFTQYKSSTVARRIERRMGIHQLTNLQEYHALLIKSTHEVQTLSKDLLIGVTRFFRDDEAFNELEKNVIPSLLEDTPKEEPLRIWVGGCSTGEEAYSIAILFEEALRRTSEARTVKIFATDVDPDAIAEAGAGRFPLNLQDDISDERLNNYFTKENESYTVSPMIRQMIVFAVHNLIKDPPFSNIHLATCRNVLIYFQTKAQKRVLSMLHFSLLHNGYLFLGGSESLGDIQTHFEVIHERGRVFRKVMNARISSESSMPNRRLAQDGLSPSVESLMRGYQGSSRTNSYATIMEKIIGDYIPPCALLDDEMNILHVYGDIGEFTEKIKPGRFSAKITNLVTGDLSVALSTALHRAVTQESDIQYNDVHLKTDDNVVTRINLKVRYVKNIGVSNVNLLVLFENTQVTYDREESKTVVFDASEQTQQRIDDLESELQKSQEHLQVTVEELETTNEELQASNEELLAANEELQSTNEELQSVNEELYTVNNEYQEKISELTQANTDLDNIMKSTDIGIVFLDDDMLIRSFTPASTQQINLLDSDIGRPFHHMAHNLKYPNLLDDISKVIETEKTEEKEIQTKNNSVVVVKIYPYYNEIHESHGCVLAITNISHLKALEGKLSSSYQELRSTIGTSLISEHKKLSVLIVDDDDIDRESLSRRLDDISSIEFDVTEAKNYSEALKTLSENYYDICLLDYSLGGETAFELLSELPKQNSIPFILLSGHIDDVMQEKALRLGIYDSIDKEVLTSPLLERCIHYTMRHKKTEEYLSQESTLESYNIASNF